MRRSLEARRVLVVEDEFFLAEDMREALERAGAQVVGPAPTAAEALALIGSGRVDLAVVDINLKGAASFDVPDLLTQRNVPFLFATGYDAAILPERFAGTPRWEKPYRIGDLVEELKRLGASGAPDRKSGA